MLTRATLFLVASLLWSCGEPNGFERGCDSQVSFSVSAGLTPEIGWAPNCKLGVLAISEYPGLSGAPGERVSATWMIRTSDQFGPDNLLELTIRYGELPSGASGAQDPPPLMTGTEYVVQGWVFDLDGQMSGAGSTAFRP
jgi:hypothetical protein